MCTLVIAWQVVADRPVVVAANRDEATDRPSSPPERWNDRPGIVAPRDDLAGGTWIGYNDHGVFAGISNRWLNHELSAGRSRGQLVVDALGHPSAGSAVAAVEAALAADDYDGFNLLVADADAAILLEWDGHLRVTDLEPGLHVVMNAGYDDRFRAIDARPDAAGRQAESARLVRDALRPRSEETATQWLDRAGDVLGDHDYGVCVHGDGYGTRSSSLLAIDSTGAATMCYADGPPCSTDFEAVEGQS